MRNNPAADLQVYVIWEPVLQTDWARPDASITANIADPRARHYWDPARRLSAMYGGAANAQALAAASTIQFKMKDVLWDAELVYAPGARWLQAARTLTAPVYRFAGKL